MLFRSVSHQAYMDWGLHTDDVTLARPKAPPHAHPSHVPNEKVFCVRDFFAIFTNYWKVRQVHSDPQLGFVNALGYISLFPFILQVWILLWPDLIWYFVDFDPRLSKIGFASLLLDQPGPSLHAIWPQKSFSHLPNVSRICFYSRQLHDPHFSRYMKRNTEHDAPYWRGPIWININFLAIRCSVTVRSDRTRF